MDMDERFRALDGRLKALNEKQRASVAKLAGMQRETEAALAAAVREVRKLEVETERFSLWVEAVIQESRLRAKGKQPPQQPSA